MLVLPRITRPAVAAAAGTTVASYGGHPALEDLRAAGRRHALGGEDVLERERHAGQRAELLARGDPVLSTAAAAARARSVSTCRNACTARRPRRSGPGGLGDLDRGASPAAIAPRQLGGGAAGSGRSVAHASSSRIRGTRKRSSSAAGRAGQRRSRRQRRAHLVRRGTRWSAAARARSAGCRRPRPRPPGRPPPRITSSWRRSWSSSSSARSSRASRARWATSSRLIWPCERGLLGFDDADDPMVCEPRFGTEARSCPRAFADIS